MVNNSKNVSATGINTITEYILYRLQLDATTIQYIVGTDGRVYNDKGSYSGTATTRTLWLRPYGKVEATTASGLYYQHNLLVDAIDGDTIYILCGQYLHIWKQADKAIEPELRIMQVPDTNRYVYVSNVGTVFSDNWDRLTPSISAQNGYCELRHSWLRGIPQYIHQLVLQAYTNIPMSNKYSVDHIDGDYTNNRLDNLQIMPPATTIWGYGYNVKKQVAEHKKCLNGHIAYMHRYGTITIY